MCNKIKCAIQYTVDLINNIINRDVQEESATASHFPHKHLMKQQRVYLSLSCGDVSFRY